MAQFTRLFPWFALLNFLLFLVQTSVKNAKTDKISQGVNFNRSRNVVKMVVKYYHHFFTYFLNIVLAKHFYRLL